MSKKILVYAGTFEGRALAERFENLGLKKEDLIFSVATDYGTECLEDLKGVTVKEGRLDVDEMISLGNKVDMVIDATHPYAQIVTENIIESCKLANKPYYRLLRDENTLEKKSNLTEVEDVDKAIDYLNTVEGNILLTTGSKELHKFSRIDGFKERVFARVLPSVESIDLCKKAGMQSKNIIAMQGPFSLEMNQATLRQYKCKTMVSKNTGRAGGFEEKLKCLSLGINLVVITRPVKEEGYTFNEIVKIVEKQVGK